MKQARHVCRVFHLDWGWRDSASPNPSSFCIRKTGATNLDHEILKLTEQILCQFLWLGKRYGNITFEDDSLDFDISEIDSVYEDEFLSAYQNYLGGGLRGCVGNSCTIEDWQMDEKLVRLATKLSEYYEDRMREHEYIDEYNEMTVGRPVSYPGL